MTSAEHHVRFYRRNVIIWQSWPSSEQHDDYFCKNSYCLLNRSKFYKIWFKQFAVNRIKSMSVCRIKNKNLGFWFSKVWKFMQRVWRRRSQKVTHWVSFLDLSIIILNLSIFEKQIITKRSKSAHLNEVIMGLS